MHTSNPLIVRIVALLILPALLTVEPAFAAGATQVPPSVTVRYEDLNLNSPRDVAGLYKRIENAATEVCRPAEGPQSISRIHWTAWNHCFYHAIASAVHTVRNDKLSAYHWQRVHGWSYPGSDVPAAVASR
jgi:UrcA family protein